MKKIIMIATAALMTFGISSAFASPSSVSVTIGNGDPFVVDTGGLSSNLLGGDQSSPEARTATILDDLAANGIDVEHVGVDVSLDDVLDGHLDHTIGQNSAIDFVDDAARDAYEQAIDDAMKDQFGDDFTPTDDPNAPHNQPDWDSHPDNPANQ